MASLSRSLLPLINAVGKHDQRLAAMFRRHDLVGSQKDRVVEHFSPSSATRPVFLVFSGCFGALGIVLRLPGRAHLIQILMELVARIGEVVDELNLAYQSGEGTS